MFVMKVLQEADSATQHQLMQHCQLITGASGGMIAAAYYRELYRRKMLGENIDIDDEQYLENISGDLLNAVGFALVVNDLFYPWQHFTVGDTRFRKDRGYMFEKVLNENTGNVLAKPVSAYKTAEQQAQIPMMLFYPTILNDERKLFIGAQKFSYMCIAPERLTQFSKPEIDGVDYQALFAANNADSLSFTSVLRMNCTFPYILPNVHLPTNPDIEVMDAGVRDNYGIQASGKFIEEFRDWINENTSGVVLVNIRGIEQEMKIHEDVTKGVFEKFFSPIGTLYNNWVEIQDYQNENIINLLSSLLQVKTEVITFQYLPEESDNRASLSLHLTAKEKRDIVQSATSVYNEAAYKKLEEVLK
jgi:translation initiation factor 1 (eIF-1/SUI1)